MTCLKQSMFRRSNQISDKWGEKPLLITEDASETAYPLEHRVQNMGPERLDVLTWQECLCYTTKEHANYD